MAVSSLIFEHWGWLLTGAVVSTVGFFNLPPTWLMPPEKMEPNWLREAPVSPVGLGESVLQDLGSAKVLAGTLWKDTGETTLHLEVSFCPHHLFLTGAVVMAVRRPG